MSKLNVLAIIKAAKEKKARLEQAQQLLARR